MRSYGLAAFALVLAAECGWSSAQTISSLGELLALQRGSNQKVKLQPGTYTLDLDARSAEFGGEWLVEQTGTWPAFFQFDGSNNEWDFTDVTIVVKGEAYSEFPNLAHGSQIDLGGTNNKYYGLTWVDTPSEDGSFGKFIHVSGGSIFQFTGESNTVSGFDITSHGSAPYGWGSIYGKTGSSAGMMPGTRLSKKTTLGVSAQNLVFENSSIQHSGLGHISAFYNGATGLVRNVVYNADTRSTDDLLANQANGVDRFGVPFHANYNGEQFFSANNADLRDLWTTTDMNRCQSLGGGTQFGPIRPGYQFSLVEDGLRAYSNTVVIDVENVSIYGARGGIVNQQSINSNHIVGLTVRATAGHGVPSCAGAWNSASPDKDGASFSPPVNSRVYKCAGDAPYSPLIDLNKNCGYSLGNVVLDVELLDPLSRDDYHRVDDTLGFINGGPYNRVRVWKADGKALERDLELFLGSCAADKVLLCNLTPQKVSIGSSSKDATVFSMGSVEDSGSNSVVESVSSLADEPDVCKMLSVGGDSAPVQDMLYDIPVFLSGSTARGWTPNCGWFGCRVAKLGSDNKVTFGHGANVPEEFFLRVPAGSSASSCVEWGSPVVISRSASNLRQTAFVNDAKELEFTTSESSSPAVFYIREFRDADSTEAQPTGCVHTGDDVVIALTPERYKTSACGWFGCRVASYVEGAAVSFTHGTAVTSPFYLRSFDAALNSGRSFTPSVVSSGVTESGSSSSTTVLAVSGGAGVLAVAAVAMFASRYRKNTINKEVLSGGVMNPKRSLESSPVAESA